MQLNGWFQIDGILPIIPTPFGSNEQVDWEGLRHLLDFACSLDLCGFCLPAYASEFYKLSEVERNEVVVAALEHVNGRMPVVAQVNFVSAVHAAEAARFAQRAGASAVAVAVPHQFAVAETDLLRYFDRILSAIDIPLLIQDFNPGGPTVSSGFVAKLNLMHPHFRWVKLEEPMMAPRVASILDATSGAVGVLEGWGGMYLMDLASAGICGVMPGLGVSDLLAKIYRLLKGKQVQEAFELFQGVLPQIAFSLQSMELFHHAEKRLLAARGLLVQSTVRELNIELLPHYASHIDFLNSNVLALLDRVNLPRCPALTAAAIKAD